MQMYDILMIVVLAGATLFGFIKGLAWQIASLASLVISYFLALHLSPQIAPVFGDSEPWNRFVAMLVVYIACSALIWLAFRVVAKFIDRVKLKEFDRQMGALCGLAKGVLWCVAITFFAVTLMPPEQKEAILTSRSGYFIGELLDRTHDIVPEEVHNVIHPYLEKIKQRIDPSGEPVDSDWPPQDWPKDGENVDWSANWPDAHNARRGEEGQVQ